MKRTTTKLAMDSSPIVKNWPAWESETPGLIVCRKPYTWKKDDEVIPSDRWQINHDASGQVMGPSFRLRSEALAFCTALAPLADWTQTAEKLGPLVEQLEPQIVKLWNELS